MLYEKLIKCFQDLQTIVKILLEDQVNGPFSVFQNFKVLRNGVNESIESFKGT